MKSFLPALLIAFSATAVSAQDLSAQDAAQKNAVGGAVSQQKALQQTAVAALRAAPLRVGQAGPAQFSNGVMKNSAAWLKQTPQIVQFINENGCAIKDGKYATVKMTCSATAGAAAAGAPACVDFSKIVDDVAKNTEVVYVDRQTMRSITGNPQAIAFGVTKELKKLLRNAANPDQPLVLGAASKNTIALRGEPVAADQQAPDSGVFSLVLAHEFLHITLRQIDNPALGGGARKTEEDPAIANLHHRLTDVLQWKAVSWGQSDGGWKPGPDPNAPCAKAGQAAAP